MKNIAFIVCMMISSMAFSMDKEDMKVSYAAGQCSIIQGAAGYARVLPPEEQEVIANMIIAYATSLGVDVDTYAQFCTSITKELTDTMTGTNL